MATNLRRLRRRRGWSQEALAAEARLSRTYLADVERCHRNISLDNIQKLATALGVTESDLLSA